jgi:uncharacterized membrane protein YphA (DoxX/SURF4 family)
MKTPGRALFRTAGRLLTGSTFVVLGAAVLAGSMVPTTLAGHAFWKVEDPAARKAQRIQFLKNAALVGGLLFEVALDQPKKKAKKSKK